MKKVMVFGTFDIFHPGHENFLKQAKRQGDFLIAVVARDKTVLEVKKKKPINNEKKRFEIIKRSGLVDRVVLGGLGNKYVIIKKYLPEVICLGYDQGFFAENLAEKLKEVGVNGVVIKKMKPYKNQQYKSSILATRAC